MAPRYDNVIFDLDGVLIDNSSGIFGCIRRTCARLGLAVPGDDILKKFIGPSLKFSFREYMGLDAGTVENAVRFYRSEYEEHGVLDFRLYDGVMETLRELKRAGISCCIASGKLKRSVVRIAEKSGMGKYMDVISAFDEPPPVSDKTEKILGAITGRSPIMVGDRIFDLEGAAKAGIDCAYALYGFGSADEIAAYPGVPLLKTARDILKTVL